jgi:hypothetical protein
MSNDNFAVCVLSERPVVARQRYELSVYRFEGRFYTSWFCAICGQSYETTRCESESLAHDEGMAAIEAHHATLHSGASR